MLSGIIINRIIQIIRITSFKWETVAVLSKKDLKKPGDVKPNDGNKPKDVQGVPANIPANNTQNGQPFSTSPLK